MYLGRAERVIIHEIESDSQFQSCKYTTNFDSAVQVYIEIVGLFAHRFKEYDF